MTDISLKQLILQMPTLETERLVLRKLIKSDASDMYEYCSNSNVPRFLTWEPHDSLRYTKNYLRFLIKKYKTGEYLDWGIVLKANGKLIGTCGFTSIFPEHSKGEIGYVLNEAYWNNGYATEAVKRVLDYTFKDLELNRIEARVIEGNIYSSVVLNKCGMTLEGTFKNELFIKGSYRNIHHFAICRDEYMDVQ